MTIQQAGLAVNQEVQILSDGTITKAEQTKLSDITDANLNARLTTAYQSTSSTT